MSIGLLWLHAARRMPSSAAMVSADERGQLPSILDQRIVARTPGPPALVRIASPRPWAGAAWTAPRPCRRPRKSSRPAAPHAAKGSVQDLVAAGQRSGVRRGRLGRRLGPPRLDHDDRLGQGHLTRGRQERGAHRRSIPCRSTIHFVYGIITQVIDQVAPPDIKHRADRDERAETDVRLEAPVEDGRAQGAALADESNRARPGDLGGEGRVHTAVRPHHTQAVGPDDSHPAPGVPLLSTPARAGPLPGRVP